MAEVALVISTIAAIFGIFGGIPGIRTTFYNRPNLEIQGFMPAVVFDEGFDLQGQYPKFSLKGLLRVANPNDHDISMSEMKLYGITRATSNTIGPMVSL